MDNTVENTRFNNSPEWAKTAIWYQIFVERFYNGNNFNNPQIESIKGAWPHDKKNNWEVTKWESNWYKNTPKNSDINSIKEWYDEVQSRRYGGDLLGVIEKLDYLEDLGINAIYFNPLNDAPSLHKYDVRNYHHIDINFGPNPILDKQIISEENPFYPESWQWTSADKLFLDLVAEIHKRGMRVILDFSWNHTGSEFWAWKDVLKNGINSPYSDWYDIKSFNTSSDNKFEYVGWAGVKEMPLIRKIKYSNHIQGEPYDGTLPDGFKKHVFDVCKRWLSPNGYDQKIYGIDGFRLDVADEIGMNFWREFRTFVRKINPNAFLIGEVWWKNWPHSMMDPAPYLQGDIFDSVMFYQPYRHSRAFFSKSEEYKGIEEFINNLKASTNHLSYDTIQSMMMMASSHDTPRLLSSFYNKGIYKFNAKPTENPDYKTYKPDAETYKRVRNLLVFQFTMPGAPHIWAGEEMGMWGADDPDCRKPLWWKEFDFEQETKLPFYSNSDEKESVGFNQEHFNFYKKIIHLRKKYKAFNNGNVQFVYYKNDVLIYKCSYNKECIYVIFNNNSNDIILEDLSLYGLNLWTGNNQSITETKKLKAISFQLIKVKQ